jgi:hypothetical protein
MKIRNKKERNLPLAGPISGPYPRPLSPRARELPPLSAHLRPAPSRPPARSVCAPLSLSLDPTRQPSLTFALSCPRTADKPAPSVSHPIFLAAHGSSAVTSDHRPLLLPCLHSPHREVRHIFVLACCGRVLAWHRPAERSHRRRCAPFTPLLCTSPAST